MKLLTFVATITLCLLVSVAPVNAAECAVVVKHASLEASSATGHTNPSRTYEVSAVSGEGAVVVWYDGQNIKKASNNTFILSPESPVALTNVVKIRVYSLKRLEFKVWDLSCPAASGQVKYR